MKYLILSVLFISCTNNKPKPKEISNYKELKTKMLVSYNEDNYQETLKYIHQLLQIDTTDGEVYFTKGYCESGLFNTTQSTKAYSKAVELNYRKVDAVFNIGTNALLNCDSLAVIYINQCLAMDPNYEPGKVQLDVIKQHPSKNYGHCK